MDKNLRSDHSLYKTDNNFSLTITKNSRQKYNRIFLAKDSTSFDNIHSTLFEQHHSLIEETEIALTLNNLFTNISHIRILINHIAFQVHLKKIFLVTIIIIKELLKSKKAIRIPVL